MNRITLKNFFIEHKRTILLIAFSLLFFGLMCSIAFAQADPATAGVKEKPKDVPFDIFKPLAELLYAIALGVGGVFVFVGGLALDLSIQQLVINFGGLFHTEFGRGVVSVWQIIRDIFNIVFIFAFIYIGIRTILNSEDSGTRRAIGNLIVAALFINFSLLICQTIIDFSNVAAIQIYNHITTGGVGASGIDGTFSTDIMELGQNSISGAFLNLTNLTTLFGGDSDIIKDMTATQILVYSILMMVFLVLAGFIFLFAAIHIIYRFVALIIYMILSPVLFAGLILPNFQSYTKRWLHGLLKQSFFAPAFLFLIYVSLLSMKTLKESLVLGGGMFQELNKGGSMDINEFGIFLFFAITIGFIYASVKVGDMMGIAGAGTTLKMIDGARHAGQKFIGGATLGALGGVGRSTIGRMAHNYAESDAAKDAASKRGLSGVVARAGLRSSRIVGDASFDVRRTGITGKLLGEAKKGGYKTKTEEIEKKEKAFAKSLDEVDDEDTQVRAFIMEKEKLEADLKQLKIDKEGTPDGVAKKTIAKNIVAAEENIKRAEERIKQEKSRRQIGTDADAKKAEETKDRYDASEKEKGELKDQFKAAVEAEDEAKKKEIAEAMNKLIEKQKELAKEAKKAKGTLGYAGVLETRGFWGSAVLGRVVSQDHEAGKAIRKQYAKTVKQSKSDAEAATLRETVEKAAKKD